MSERPSTSPADPVGGLRLPPSPFREIPPNLPCIFKPLLTDSLVRIKNYFMDCVARASFPASAILPPSNTIRLLPSQRMISFDRHSQLFLRQFNRFTCFPTINRKLFLFLCPQRNARTRSASHFAAVTCTSLVVSASFPLARTTRVKVIFAVRFVVTNGFTVATTK